MKWYLASAASALALFVPVAAVHASGDFSCSPVWKLSNASYGCNDSAVLAPGNDTRVNMFYLLRDRQGVGTAGLSYAPLSDETDLSLGHNFLSWDAFPTAFYRRSAVDEGGGDDHAGSRCISLALGDRAFDGAMEANRGLPAAERGSLLAARGNLAQTCSTTGAVATPPSWPAVTSAPGREYLGYLQAANAFYAGDWAAARQGFAKLNASRDPWVAETAAYMLPRTELNAAQVTAFDEYGSFEVGKVDKAALGRAQAGFGDYLKHYAKGRYAASAGGLVRRTMWLAGDVAGLSREYERLLIGTPVTNADTLDLLQEIDNKLLIPKAAPGAVDGPLLLATVDLMLMRPSESDPGDTANADRPVLITVAQIAAQEPRFAGRADLFGFVQANHAFYVQKDPRQVLALIPDGARQASFTPVQFSRQVLRGQALSALKDRNAPGFWRELLGGATALYQRPVVELGLALDWERSGQLGAVFAPGSPIGESSIREILLANVASPDLLRAQAKRADRPQHERDVALFTLLRKQLMYGDYAGYLTDAALVRAGAPTEGSTWNLEAQQKIPLGLFRSAAASDGYPCAPLARSVAALAHNPRDAKALLCLGEFYRNNGFDDYGLYSTVPKSDELGGTATLFPGRVTPRSGLYVAVIADPAAGANEKAYALYRAINCYAPSGSNSCGGTDAPKSQRQAWFARLKRDYPATEWAKTLRYYW
jgi:hypothetical protein